MEKALCGDVKPNNRYCCDLNQEKIFSAPLGLARLGASCKMVQHHGQSKSSKGRFLLAGQVVTFWELEGMALTKDHTRDSGMDAIQKPSEKIYRINRSFQENGAFSSAREKDFIKNWQVTSSLLHCTQHADANSDCFREGRLQHIYVCLWDLGHMGSLLI